MCSSLSETFQDWIDLYSIKDTHPIRAACFNNTGDSFAIGTNSKSLKLYSLALSVKQINRVVLMCIFKCISQRERG